MSDTELSTQVDGQEQHEVSILWFKGPHQNVSHEVSIFIRNLDSKDGEGTRYDPLFLTQDGVSPLWLWTSTASCVPHQCNTLGGQLILGTITATALNEFRYIIEQTVPTGTVDQPSPTTTSAALESNTGMDRSGPYRSWMFQIILEAIKRKILPEEALDYLAFVPVLNCGPGDFHCRVL